MREANTTPLTPHLAKALIPQKCHVPAFECYDGSSDPAKHLRYYNRILARWEQDDAVLCRYFPSSLKGSTLSWFDNLPPNSINSYDQLAEKFLETYMYNKAVNARMDKLFSLEVVYKETMREYTDRWHKICQAIGNVDPVVSINCYKWGLDRMSPLFVEIHGKQASGSKRGGAAERPNDDKRGRRDDRRRDNRKFKDQVFTKLNTNYTRILREIKDREILEWPWSKGKQPPRTEKSRDYCEYHFFNGHQTEKCKNLKIMIQKLIDVGDLKKYIQKAETEDRAKRSKQVQLPEGNRSINTISCSEATGPSLTAQIGKRLRNQFEDYCELYKIDGVEVEEHEQWMNAPITFDAEDIEEYMEDHNDPLVLTLPVAGCNIRKIFIDGGRSVNVLFYDAFNRMEMNDEHLMSSYYTIYGFNGAPRKPLGDIVLQVDAGPMKVDT
ncbi:uncharacterized protein LOC113337437 [Papaver somniferum]|uniref:uncharacterized protein LOC113337437 n=1 Tax=Papaver somniferum TaxID=3469 RepID=UPI000E705D03|nr:uncharacterized protein LOC113337437 [Papaver somniferum]